MIAGGASRRAISGVVWTTVIVLTAIVLVFAGVRVLTDGSNLVHGTVPSEGSYERRYALHPVLAYAHILPGALYLVGAVLQLSRPVRQRHLYLHRRMGRAVVAAGIVAGVYAVVFGALFSWGGLGEAAASVVFGLYFVTALVMAFRAVRTRDIARHRQWMVRAFAVGLAVGTIRVWVGLLQAFGLLAFKDGFAVAFWLSFVLHALAAEVYLSRRPHARGSTFVSRSVASSAVAAPPRRPRQGAQHR